MIITKTTLFTQEEIDQLKEQFGTYIKTVIDVRHGICSAGSRMHFECEQLLLEQGSKQQDLWGGGIDLQSRTINYNAMVNMRPNDQNTSDEIMNPDIRKTFETLMRNFFLETLK